MLTGLAIGLWVEVDRLRVALGIASGALDGAAFQLTDAGRRLRRGASAMDYASATQDAFDATVEYAYRIGTLNVEALRALSELDPGKAVRMADEASAAAAVLSEHMPDLAEARRKFIEGLS